MRRGFALLPCLLLFSCDSGPSPKQLIAECMIDETHRPLTAGANDLYGENARGADIEVCMQSKGYEIAEGNCPSPSLQQDWQGYGIAILSRAEKPACYSKIGGFSSWIASMKTNR